MLLLLAAAVAPTDAGLGAATVLNPVVPVRVRRMLNVESGLNDGLCTPFVLFAIAALAGEEGLAPGREHRRRAGRPGRRHPRRRGRRRRRRPAARLVARARLQLAAHPAPRRARAPPHRLLRGRAGRGQRVRRRLRRRHGLRGAARWLEEEESSLALTEALADPLGFAVWFAFGFIAVPLLVEHVGWPEVVFAVLALTLLRMVPVALALLGTGLRPRRSRSSGGSGRAGWPRWSSPCSRPRGSSSTRT